MTKTHYKTLIRRDTGAAVNRIVAGPDFDPGADFDLVDEAPPFDGAIWNGNAYNPPSPEYLAARASALKRAVEDLAARDLAGLGTSPEALAMIEQQRAEIAEYEAAANKDPADYPYLRDRVARETGKPPGNVTKADFDAISIVSAVKAELKTRAQSMVSISNRRDTAMTEIDAAATLEDQEAAAASYIVAK